MSLVELPIDPGVAGAQCSHADELWELLEQQINEGTGDAYGTLLKYIEAVDNELRILGLSPSHAMVDEYNHPAA